MISKIWNNAKTIHGNKVALFLFLIGVVIRLSYVVYAYNNDIMDGFKDDKYYYHMAIEMSEQGKLFYTTDDPAYDIVGPGLVWINGLTIIMFGDNWLGIFIISAIASGLIVFFTYKTARLILDEDSALLAGIWSCVYLFYIMFSARAGKDIWMSTLMIVLLYLLLVQVPQLKVNYPLFILFTFIFVFSFHLDERYFMFSPFIFFYFLVIDTNGFRQFRFTKSILFVLLVILFMLPWSIRNYYKHNKVVLISTRTERLTDRLLGYESRELPIDYLTDLKGKNYIHDYQIDSVLNGSIKYTDGGTEISEAQRQTMLKGKLPHEFTFQEAVWSRTKIFLRPFQIGGEFQKTGYFYYKKSFKHNLASFFFYGIMFFFAIPGFYWMFNKNRTGFILLLSTILIYTAIHALFVPWTTWRYRLPLDSLFIITGSFGIVLLLHRIKNIIKNSY